ncbi:MAG: DUF4139 domain-containing protein [Candidatus Kapabacteria bacterium]|nr:DUF4139 domain-containing protein [Candidatus Kapabacteria bacterium]
MATGAQAQQATTSTANDIKKTSVTVYNSGFGIVREQRVIKLEKGANLLRYEDVASTIDPTSISIKSLTQPDALAVREQNYQYDLLTPTSILNKSVGKKIRFKRMQGTQSEIIEGTLLNPPTNIINSPDGSQNTYSGLVIRTNDGKIILNPVGEAILDEVPSGLVARPSLVWLLNAAKSGEQTTEVAYMANQMQWKADYVAVVNETDTKMDLTGWVTLDNKSGGTYSNAQLQLIAGDVRRVQEEQPMYPKMARGYMTMEAASAPEFKEESFFEYHLYTLDAPTTIRDNETKQMQLMSAANAGIKKKLIFDGSRYNFSGGMPGGGAATDEQKAAVVVEIKNEQANNMGVPLPKGKVRVYKADQRGNLQFVGEDRIDHTPKDELVRLYIGDAFDVVGTRKQTSVNQISDRVNETSYEITIRNRKETTADVSVVEHFWGDWQITQKNTPFEKLDARSVEFPLTLKKGESKTITFTVRTKW